MERVRTFHLRLSPRTVYLRFAHLLGEFPDELVAWLVRVDGDQRVAFVATGAGDDLTQGSKEEIIAIARYNQVRPRIAEMAAVIADAWQGRGLGPIMIYRLAIYSRSRGYTTFVGEINRSNSRALRALMRCELPYTLTRLDDETLLVALDITGLDHLQHLAGLGE